MLLCQTMRYPDGKFVLYVATRNSDREFNETRRAPTPPELLNCINKLRFVANPFATIPPTVTSTKLHFNEEFGSFLFFIFPIS